MIIVVIIVIVIVIMAILCMNTCASMSSGETKSKCFSLSLAISSSPVRRRLREAEGPPFASRPASKLNTRVQNAIRLCS